MQKCGFCGSTVVVPPEMFGGGPERSDQAIKMAEVRRLIAGKQKLEAIKVFRESFGGSLLEAKEAVDSIEEGAEFDISEYERRVFAQATSAARQRRGNPALKVITVVTVLALLIAGVAIVATFTSSVQRASRS